MYIDHKGNVTYASPQRKQNNKKAIDGSKISPEKLSKEINEIYQIF